MIQWQVAGKSFALALDVKVSIPSVNSTPSVSSRNEADIQVLIAPFISRATQEQLESRGISYLDPTGNLLLQSQTPFMWIKQEGSNKNPNPNTKETSLQSLKGRSASEVMVRLLSDGRAATVRELARESGVGLGTASRVITLLRDENFLKPTGGGPLVVLDPLGLARRWAEDYSFEKTYKAKRYFSILGSSVALERIQESGANYAITGMAAQALLYEADARVAPLPSSELWLYTDDVERIEKVADLVPDSSNGTIMVAQSNFLGAGRERYRPVSNTRSAWPWRVVGDLMSLSGRYASAGSDFAKELIARSPGPYA